MALQLFSPHSGNIKVERSSAGLCLYQRRRYPTSIWIARLKKTLFLIQLFDAIFCHFNQVYVTRFYKLCHQILIAENANDGNFHPCHNGFVALVYSLVFSNCDFDVCLLRILEMIILGSVVE